MGPDPFPLHLDDVPADGRDRRDRAHRAGDVGATYLRTNALTIEAHDAVDVGDVGAGDDGRDLLCVVGVHPGAQHSQGGRPVGAPGVEIRQSPGRRHAPGHRRLPHASGPVYGDDHIRSRTS